MGTMLITPAQKKYFHYNNFYYNYNLYYIYYFYYNYALYDNYNLNYNYNFYYNYGPSVTTVWPPLTTSLTEPWLA